MRYHPSITTLLAAAALLSATTARALEHYYLGIDDLPTIASGIYAGLPNPNFNRLTFLYAPTYEGAPETWHYHSKGIYRYTGPNLGAGTATTFTVSDYVPEGIAPPIKLQIGTGIYAGALVTEPYTDVSLITSFSSDLTIASTQSLDGFGPTDGETYLFNSSVGRWNSPFDDADVHFELISLTPGLNVGDATNLNIMTNPGDDWHVGDGSTNFSFTPILWTADNAAPGIYEAKFKLVDESGAYGSSGEFRIRTEVVPEPSTAATLLGGVALLLARRRRAQF